MSGESCAGAQCALSKSGGSSEKIVRDGAQ